MTRSSSHLVALLVAVGLCAASAPAAAQQRSTQSDVGLGLKGLGARIGFVDPEDASSTVLLGVHVDMGTLVPNLHVTPYGEYWSVGATVGTVNVDRSDLMLGVDLDFDFPLQGARTVPYAGGGLGLHFLNAKDSGGGSNDDAKLGLNIQGGVKTQTWPNLSLFGEVRYHFVSDANQLKAVGGFTYNFIY